MTKILLAAWKINLVLFLATGLAEDMKPKEVHRLKVDCFAKSIAYSPDGKQLAVGGGAMFGQGGKVLLFDTATGKEITRFKMQNEDPIFAIAYSPDGKTLALGRHNSTVELWDAENYKWKANCPVEKEFVGSVAFSPDGKTIAAASLFLDSNNFRASGFVKLFDTANGVERVKLSGHTSRVDAVAYSPDGKTLASASSDKSIKLWDTVTNQERTELKGHTFEDLRVVFSPDGKLIATSAWDNTVRLWDPATGMQTKIFDRGPTNIQGIAFSPDSKVIAAVTLKGEVFLWDTAKGDQLGRFSVHDGEMYCIAFAPDGKTIATGSRDETVRIWDVSKMLPPKGE